MLEIEERQRQESIFGQLPRYSPAAAVKRKKKEIRYGRENGKKTTMGRLSMNRKENLTDNLL